MKRFFAVILSFAMVLSFMTVVNAEDGITVIVNGVEVEFDVPPMIINGRTMIPVRKVFEMLGANVEWVAEMRLALATYKTNIIAIGIDKYSFSVTDVISGQTKSVSLDVPAQIVNDRTLIPLRAVAEALGNTVEWKEDTRTAKITG